MKAEVKHDTTRLNLNVRQGMLGAHMKWALAAVALMSILATTPAAATGSKSPGLKVFGLTADQRLVKFRSNRPRQLREIGVVSPLQAADTSLVGIDFRVQDGQLYGVGNAGGIYIIDTSTAAPTLVSQLSVPLDVNATFFGVDFNPAANRLRIISDQGQNLAHNIDDGATAGTTLVNGMLNDPPPAVQVPPTIAKGVTGAAYTNNDLPPGGASTATTLFDIDTVRDQVSIQAPPGAGTLSPTGKLGVDTDVAVGFDIYTQLQKGVAISNAGFASLVVGGVTGFYSVNLLTGKATRIGKFYEPVVDIAVRLNQ